MSNVWHRPMDMKDSMAAGESRVADVVILSVGSEMSWKAACDGWMSDCGSFVSDNTCIQLPPTCTCTCSTNSLLLEEVVIAQLRYMMARTL